MQKSNRDIEFDSIVANKHPVMVEIFAKLQLLSTIPTCQEVSTMIYNCSYWSEGLCAFDDPSVAKCHIKSHIFHFIEDKILYVDLENERDLLERLRKLTNNFSIINLCSTSLHLHSQTNKKGWGIHYKPIKQELETRWNWKMEGIANSIYNQNTHCLSVDELENVVPFYPDAPHYIREKVFVIYLERMRNLKPRGEEFDMQLAILKSSVEELESYKTWLVDEYIKQ